jgi:hypothetical protein
LQSACSKFKSGQGANSQLGRVLPTAEPSGQIFASLVHALDDSTQPKSIAKTNRILKAIISFFIFIPPT